MGRSGVSTRARESCAAAALWLLARYNRQAERSRATAMRLFLSLRKSNEKRDDELEERLEDAAREAAATEDEVPEDGAPQEDGAPRNVLPLRNEANEAAEGADAQVPPRDDAAAAPGLRAKTATPLKPTSEAR